MESNLSNAALDTHQLPEKDLERRMKIKAVGKSAQGNQHKFPQQSHSANKQSSSDTALSLLDCEYFVIDLPKEDSDTSMTARSLLIFVVEILLLLDEFEEPNTEGKRL